LQWLGIRPPACLPTFLRLLLPCQLIAVGLPGVSSLSAGPIMPLAPKLFLEGTTERNTTLVSRLPMNRLLRVFGCCMLAAQAAAHVGLLHVGLLHVGLCLRPWGSCCVLPSVATDIQRIGSVCSAALLQIPAANVMHTGYNTTSLIVSGPRPASATLLWLAASTAPHHFSPIQLHAPLSICACLILPACLPQCVPPCPALPCLQITQYDMFLPGTGVTMTNWLGFCQLPSCEGSGPPPVTAQKGWAGFKAGWLSWPPKIQSNIYDVSWVLNMG
jgi:hypothetical protein